MKKTNLIERQYLSDTYSILVGCGGAVEHMRDAFIESHVTKGNPYPCDEWRFSGRLGFGGKYRRETNRVDYYSEDYLKERDDLVKIINGKLAENYKTYKAIGLGFSVRDF